MKRREHKIREEMRTDDRRGYKYKERKRQGWVINNITTVGSHSLITPKASQNKP